MENEKIYCGSAKIVPTQYGELTKISFHKDDINKIVSYMKSNEGDWINLTVKEKKDKIPNKPSHYLEVDTWKPDPSKQSNQVPYSMNQSNDSDQLPF